MFKQDNLEYNLDAFEGFISEKIMNLHYNKHHKGYTDNLNKLIEENNLENKTIEEIFDNISNLPSGVRNNGGGYFNHNFFWKCLTDKSENKQISERLKDKISEDFGSLDDFQEEFKKSALTVFGSGWVSLVLNPENKLEIIQTQNQDNTLMDFVKEKHGETKLVLNLDVWEHAYYLDYKNVRADYIDSFFKILNWKFVEKNIFG